MFLFLEVESSCSCFWRLKVCDLCFVRRLFAYIRKKWKFFILKNWFVKCNLYERNLWGVIYFMRIMLWLLFVCLNIWIFEVGGVEIKFTLFKLTCCFCVFMMIFVVFVLEGWTLIMFESIRIKVVHTS
jgi:hypothetical protein